MYEAINVCKLKFVRPHYFLWDLVYLLAQLRPVNN